ncbi:MAG: FliH/SctL family protein [bacterium]|nr:FliH/SctL family protein [bacterium]
MIIKKKAAKDTETKGAQSASKSGGNIIKGGLKGKVNPLKQKAIEKKEKEALAEAAEQEASKPSSKPAKEKQPPVPKKTELEEKLEEYEKIDVSVLEFKERYERRRGERRRGFRRIDERALVSRAQEEARSIREIAAKEGYKNGLMEAQNEIDILKSSLNEFIGAKKAAYEEISSHVLEIALAVAKKIIKKETELSNDVLKCVMSEVFDELSGNDEKVTVKVNPEDVDFAKASIPEILEDSAVDAKIVVVGDELVEKGSCTLIASNGVVDANFSTQLSIIQNAFGIYKGGE